MLNLKKLSKMFLITVVFLMSTALFATTEKIYNLKFVNGSSLSIEGDSTVHTYKTATNELGLDTDLIFDINPGIDGIPVEKLLADKSYQPKIKELVLNLVVEKFHSPTLGFDSKFNSTMKYKKHPKIVFTMTKSSIAADTENSNKFYIQTDGILSIAGKEKPVSVNSVAIVEKQKTVRLIGSKDLLMTDFGIEPPKLLFLTTDDKITVKWNLTLALVPGQNG